MKHPSSNSLLIVTLIMAILVLGGGVFLFTQAGIPGAQALGSTMVGAVLTFFFLHIHGSQTLNQIEELFSGTANSKNPLIQEAAKTGEAVLKDITQLKG